MKKKQVVALLASTALAVSVTSGCANTSVETEEPVVVEETTPDVEEEAIVEKEAEETEPEEETVIEEEQEETEPEEETIVEEEQEEALPWEAIMYDEVITMYAKKTCNVRSGPSTSYDKVNSLSWAQEVVVIGEATYEDSTWYILEYSNLDNKEYQMVASSLLQDTKPQAQAPAPQQQTTQQQQPSGGCDANCGANSNDCFNCSDCPTHGDPNGCSDCPFDCPDQGCLDCADCSDCPTYTGCSDGGISDLPEACFDCPDGGGCFDV